MAKSQLKGAEKFLKVGYLQGAGWTFDGTTGRSQRRQGQDHRGSAHILADQLRDARTVLNRQRTAADHDAPRACGSGPDELHTLPRRQGADVALLSAGFVKTCATLLGGRPVHRHLSATMDHGRRHQRPAAGTCWTWSPPGRASPGQPSHVIGDAGADTDPAAITADALRGGISAACPRAVRGLHWPGHDGTWIGSLRLRARSPPDSQGADAVPPPFPGGAAARDQTSAIEAEGGRAIKGRAGRQVADPQIRGRDGRVRIPADTSSCPRATTCT